MERALDIASRVRLRTSPNPWVGCVLVTAAGDPFDTKKRLPVTLVYVEVFENVYLAYKRERQIHNWGHNKKKALIEGNYELLHSLAECKNDSHWKNFE